MYINKHYFKGYTQGGWCEPFAAADVKLTYRYNPSSLNRYRTQYIRRAINTGFVPNKGGPTNAMCMMLFWDQKARYVARADQFHVHVTMYDPDLARTMTEEFVTLDAKAKLMQAAFPAMYRTRYGRPDCGIHVNAYSPRFSHWVPKDYETDRDSVKELDCTPFGPVQLDFELTYCNAEQKKGLLAELTQILGSPWYTEEHKQAALARMQQPFDITVNLEMRRSGPWYGTDDRTTIK